MKPDKREREAVGRKPISPDHQRYEEGKRRWIAQNPEATAEQYSAAVQRIARECGV